MLNITTIETPDLGDRSYLIHDGSVAVVVDPQRDIDRLLQQAGELGVEIAMVLETHLHNDYVSGGLDLSRVTGAPYVTPRGEFPGRHDHAVGDGEMLHCGRVALRAVLTPGHTLHHTTYVLEGEDGPLAAFTGGSLLYGTTGRPDLISPSYTRTLARAQHASARKLVEHLQPLTALYPTHGFGSFCAVSPTKETASNVADQGMQNPVLTLSESQFVEHTTTGLGPIPGYYVHAGAANARGPSPIDLSPPRRMGVDEVHTRVGRGEWVLDLRPRAAYARAHLAGTLGFDASGPFATYVAWLARWRTPVSLIGSEEVVTSAARQLARVGIDRPVAVAIGDPVAGFDEDQLRGEDAIGYRRATFAELREELDGDTTVSVVDVRWPHEHGEAHIEDSIAMPLNEVIPRNAELPPGPLWVHCGTWYRASIAASLLHNAGHDVVLIDDAFSSAAAADLPLISPSSSA